MTDLRVWQDACVSAALEHYQVSSHFFCQATPGAGKSRMAAAVASRLLQADLIDLVLCFAPSCQVVDGLQRTFSTVLGRRFDGRLGSLGIASTYQAMDYREASFWQLVEDYRVFAVFDEIHHCAGHDPLLSNAWGQVILQRLQDQAAFTLALSGTPWRSDDRAIALARYSDPEGRLICDFRYGLKEAIADKVCRSPRIVIIDNSAVRLTEHVDDAPIVTVYPSIAQLLNESPVTFEDLLIHHDMVEKVVDLGRSRLDEIRCKIPDAGGLVVATNIRHAHQIAEVLRSQGEECLVVTTRTPGAQHLINDFREGRGKWIVAVGMISEGTDIPRLQVCCYLSRIRTELHYRQVLGRVLRRTGSEDCQAWFYVLAEPSLLEFSQRVADDLPDDLAVLDYTQLLRLDDFCSASEQEAAIEKAVTSFDLHVDQFSTPAEETVVGALEVDSLFRMELSSGFRTEILSVY
ncbi:DEAD/DEAH box helicase [Pseudomonas rubra]|uniref:DEAD/DEAH box helicase family protein n=1 Tax=Pseudomonas rubra TaxID=2942627 RepID=A0ABT5P7P4_9PSED|nr:DEAD/DEAH box helicase family protein [Pseudomonas rubra]MDD1014325.1 DEAD/DEAH box helicase family protein [Pseudomonas rubra]MDD1038052.1 DEAD/DEAH box helicase family protein [Pseudomonas rubra]MDD1155485.1 DEAD/DEAH box helicase family protein [Pseudomonas rubra]